MARRTSFAISLLLACSAVLATPDPGEADRFRAAAAEYLDEYFTTHPVRATRLGIHRHDSELPDLSRPGIRTRIDRLQQWLVRVAGIDRDRLEGDEYFDHRILEYAIRAELLELEEVRGWRRNPMLYNQTLAGGVAALVDREFAPLEQRLESLIDRLGAYANVVTAARRNLRLRQVPRLWADLALSNTRGTIQFLRDGVPEALAAQGLEEVDPGLRGRWDLAHRRALRRLERFAGWLEMVVIPAAKGEFRLGPELFRRKLLYEEHVDIGLDRLEAMNEAAIADYQAWVEREAKRIDDKRPVPDVMRDVTTQHPSAAELIPTARANVEQALKFTRTHGLVDLPPDGLPTIRPTPAYARSGFASMSAPGPFETRSTEAYYNITNVAPEWSEEQQEQHLTYFNFPGLLGISVHEVMPGHWVQFLYQREVPTDVRKVFPTSSFVEGWAHYTEQMMVDEGLGEGDPKIRLGQLRRALQRHARWYAGLALHTDDVEIDEVSRRFESIAYFAPFPALRETRRGTYNPTYLYYALGRMQILELRDEYRRQKQSRGEPFSLREFHGRLLRLGLPLALAREAMLLRRP